MKIATLFLSVALLALAGGSEARACKYCFGGGAFDGPDPSQASMRMPGNTPAGEFPLDSTINKYQSGAAPAALATPPPADSIVTNAADLRPATTLPAVRPVSAPMAVVAVSAPAPVVAKPTMTRAISAHWADAGLLGLAAAGGLFCWRTRRATGSVR